MRAAETLKSSHRPHGRLTRFARCLQGGGVNVQTGGTVVISSSTISGNTAPYVRAHVQKFLIADGISSHLLRLCLCLQGGGVIVYGVVTLSSCTITGNTAGSVRGHAQNLPHCTHGRLTRCSLFAGWRCLCLFWHSVNHELPDLLQHS